MATGLTFVCSHCRYAIEACDNGNPYFLSDDGKLHFLSHNDGEERLEEYIQQSEGRFLKGQTRKDFLAKRIGIMSDLLCLDCGSKFRRDLKEQEAVCPRLKCKSKNVVAVCQLEGQTCPSCKTGRFKGEMLGVS